jgi:hypothetical protein
MSIPEDVFSVNPTGKAAQSGSVQAISRKKSLSRALYSLGGGGTGV